MQFVVRSDYVLSRVQGKNVLSVGLGGTHIQSDFSFDPSSLEKNQHDLSYTFSAKLAKAAKKITFLDLSETTIKVFKNQFDAEFFRVDITTSLDTWPAALKQEKFDVIVLGEVLEHLDCPGIALRNMSSLLSDQGVLVVTVPNAFSVKRFLQVLFRTETVHPEHTCYYSTKTLARLLDVCGFGTVDIGWTHWQAFNWKWWFTNPPLAFSACMAILLPRLSNVVVATARRTA